MNHRRKYKTWTKADVSTVDRLSDKIHIKNFSFGNLLPLKRDN